MRNFQFLISNFQKKKSPGFTLIESVVAAGVFAVATTTIVAAVLAVMRVDEKSRAIRVTEQNARFVSEFLEREIRNGSVNYSGYSGGTVPGYGTTGELRLVNAAGEVERIFLDGTNHRLRLEKITGGTTYATDLTAANVTADSLSFFISPTTDPFQVGGPDNQPQVTYNFSLTSNTSTRTRDQISIGVQSTVSLRNYPR
jgi:type II secretory pathway pseudopilin PulG